MALGGRMLMKYDGPSGDRKPPPTWDTPLLAAAAFVVGVSILVGLITLANASSSGSTLVLTYAVLVAGSYAVSRIVLGWQEDGLFGVWYRFEKPMGSMIVGDEERSPMVVAWFVLSALSVVAAGVVG
jgi:amino acid transporter